MLDKLRVVGLLALVVSAGSWGCSGDAVGDAPVDDADPSDTAAPSDATPSDAADAHDTAVATDIGTRDAADGATAAPTITSFVATPPSITTGATSTLTWTVTGGGTLTLDGAAVTGTSLAVTPTATKKYTLTATNAGGSVSADATVTVTASSVPTKPITYTAGKPFTVDSGTTNWVYVPKGYDSTHKTPMTLLVWLHGCGGESSGDIWTVSPGGTTQTWISVAPGGAEGKCWDVGKDPARVLAAIADIETHFNIKPKGVILGGYSSGGDLSYRTAFYNADKFAGILVENTSPYRDTGSTETASLAAASWKFNVVHLAHLQDTTYGIAGVRKETDSMTAAGFPLKRIEVDGGHYDNAGAIENGHAVPGTTADVATYLFPYLSKGWSAP